VVGVCFWGCGGVCLPRLFCFLFYFWEGWFVRRRGGGGGGGTTLLSLSLPTPQPLLSSATSSNRVFRALICTCKLRISLVNSTFICRISSLNCLRSFCPPSTRDKRAAMLNSSKSNTRHCISCLPTRFTDEANNSQQPLPMVCQPCCPRCRALVDAS